MIDIISQHEMRISDIVAIRWDAHAGIGRGIIIIVVLNFWGWNNDDFVVRKVLTKTSVFLNFLNHEIVQVLTNSNEELVAWYILTAYKNKEIGNVIHITRVKTIPHVHGVAGIDGYLVNKEVVYKNKEMEKAHTKRRNDGYREIHNSDMDV